ncbi:DNA binding protein [Enterococcus phage MDA1]|uniref:DNA binding protein n=1 Tax=Enterococcus phage MDA1 TaxID=2816460 RepID=A0AAE7UV85_9CAUD|nr:nucleotide kinase [Enterococcus phage MDA1]QTZ83070.1 DNA binding protein [Enterococcus phage MDA1]
MNICNNCGKKFYDEGSLWLHVSSCDRKRNNIKPTHYNKGKKDLIEMWYQTMPLEQFRGAMKSNIIKYTMRYENKNQLEDLNKAIEYLKRLKEYEEKTLG